MKRKALRFSQLIFLVLTACGIRGQDFNQMVDNLIDRSVPLSYPDSLFNKVNSDEDIVILDARAKEEYNVSHIENSIWVGYKDFELKDLKVEKGKKIVVYCSVGYRSEKIGEELSEAGYANVENLYGGIFGWVNKGYPLVDSENEKTTKVHPYSNSWGKWLTQGEKSYE